MRILTDFDGVLTEQTEEALRVRALFRERLIALTDLSAEEADSLFDHADSAMHAAPEQHGWWFGGRITAYANEDLFVRNNGLAGCLDGWADEGHPRVAPLRAALAAADVPRFMDLSQQAYEAMAAETHAGHIQPMDPATGAVLGGLLDAGHELVVVSNSGTDRIVDLLSRAGLTAARHSDDPGARLRVRGDARKYALGDTAAGFDVGPYFIDVARPGYEKILREEQAAVVIGDVFSLDLALPLHLARTEPDTFGGVRLLLRTRHYTPAWARGLFSGATEADAHLALLERLDALPGLLS